MTIHVESSGRLTNDASQTRNCEPDRHAPRFFRHIYCFEPGQEQKGHIHGEQDKVYLVLEGQGTFQVGSEKQVLGLGQRTMAPAGEEHGVKNHTGQRLKLLVFVAPNAA